MNQKLTRKALAAISTYTLENGGCTVEIVLRADRMRRAELYAWLDRRGYTWQPPYWMKGKK